MRWITYHPEIHNVHLIKDLGFLPMYMTFHGFESALVGHFGHEPYPYLKAEASGLNIIKLNPKSKWGFIDLAFAKYLKKHAAEIDVLNLYHLSRHSIINGHVYKFFNPHGFLYLKLDGYNSHLSQRKLYSKSAWKNGLLTMLEKRFFKQVDLISLENTKGLSVAKATYPEWEGKLIYFPNGINDVYFKRRFSISQPKEKIALSVGRPGSADKNYELLIAALPYLNLEEWQLIIAGPISDDFAAKWEEAKRQYPDKCRRIAFLGAIENRDELYALYNRAAVFFMPSRFESFCIAFAEALYFGAFLIGHTGMSAYDDLCGEGKFGAYFEDNNPESFAQALHSSFQKAFEANGVDQRSGHAKNFYWSTITERLTQFLPNG